MSERVTPARHTAYQHLLKKQRPQNVDELDYRGHHHVLQRATNARAGEQHVPQRGTPLERFTIRSSALVHKSVCFQEGMEACDDGILDGLA